MSKELEYLYDIWGETYTDWGCGPLTDPFTVEVFDEEDERFLAIEKALKRNIPLKVISSCCPNCELEVLKNDNYCSNCGQKIDWESE